MADDRAACAQHRRPVEPGLCLVRDRADRDARDGRHGPLRSHRREAPRHRPRGAVRRESAGVVPRHLHPALPGEPGAVPGVHATSRPERGVRGGPRHGAGGRAREIAFPGQYEPRDPDTAERRAGRRGCPRRHAAHARAEALRGCPAAERQHAARPHQRRPRLLQDRGRQGDARRHRVQPARRRGERGRTVRSCRRREGAHLHLPRGARPAGDRPRGSVAIAPDPVEPPQQRRQVHVERRGRRRGRPRGRRDGRPPLPNHRYRDRDR